MPQRTFRLRADQIKPLVERRGGCYATDMITVQGHKVGYMYREEPDFDADSGWRFLAGIESQEYLDEPDNLTIYDVNTIANYDPDIIPLLLAPIGSAFERDGISGKFVEAPDMNDLMLDFLSPCGKYMVTFDDDGKTAYAYLKDKDKKIVGDLWLYNRCETPTTREWKDRANIPFANCIGYASTNGRLAEHICDDEVVVEWRIRDGLPVACIYVLGDLFGTVGVDDHPGHSRFAIKDGPLARVLEIGPFNEAPK